MAFEYRNIDVSNRIVRELERRQITSYRLCQDIKMPNSTFSMCVNNKSKWQIDTLTKIAIYLNCTLDYLVRGISNNTENALKDELSVSYDKQRSLIEANQKLKAALIELLGDNDEQTLSGKPQAPRSIKTSPGH